MIVAIEKCFTNLQIAFLKNKIKLLLTVQDPWVSKTTWYQRETFRFIVWKHLAYCQFTFSLLPVHKFTTVCSEIPRSNQKVNKLETVKYWLYQLINVQLMSQTKKHSCCLCHALNFHGFPIFFSDKELPK